MRFNKKALQRQLDLAAQELEDKGYVDLAKHVDETNKALMEATPESVPAIRAKLTKINMEADRRDGKVAPKAKSAVVARLKARADARKAPADASLRGARKGRLAGKEKGTDLETKVAFLARRLARLEKKLQD